MLNGFLNGYAPRNVHDALRTIARHDQPHQHQVLLQRHREHGVMLGVEKFKFAQTKLTWVGYALRSGETR